MMKLKIIILLAVCCLASFVSVSAKTFVSLNGGFYIDYPEDWKQIDYDLVNIFLARNNAGKSIMNYEAVFAPDDANPFFGKEYFIISLDKTGPLNDKQIDSVLNILSTSYGKDIKYFPVADVLTDMKSTEPNYDKKNKVVSILNDIVQNGQLIKKHLIMMKFYDQGIATFYCYSPDSTFDKNKLIFGNILDSFGTENIQDKLPKEEVKIADLPNKTETYGSPMENKSYLLIISIGLVVLVIIIIYLNKQKKIKRS